MGWFLGSGLKRPEPIRSDHRSEIRSKEYIQSFSTMYICKDLVLEKKKTFIYAIHIGLLFFPSQSP